MYATTLNKFLTAVLLHIPVLSAQQLVVETSAPITDKIDKQEKKQCIEVYKAAVQKNEKVLKELIKSVKTSGYECRDINSNLPNTKGDGSSLLHIAARKGELATVKLLVQQGFPLHFQNDFGYTFLHTALYAERIDIVKEVLVLLGRKSRDVLNIADNLGDTLLHIVCYKYNTDTGLVQMLLDHGASPSVINNDGDTPISIAAMHEDMVTVSILEDYSKREQELVSLTNQFGQEELAERLALPEVSWARKAYFLMVGVGMSSVVVVAFFKIISKNNRAKLASGAQLAKKAL